MLGQRNEAKLVKGEFNQYVQQNMQLQFFKVNDNPQD